MSKAEIAALKSEVEALRQQMADAVGTAAKANQELGAMRLQRDTARTERDDARKAVATLKERLHESEIAGAHFRGKLERVDETERRASIPMEHRTVTVPFHQAEALPMTDFGYRGYDNGEKKTHWTSL